MHIELEISKNCVKYCVEITIYIHIYIYINRYFPFILRGFLNADGNGIRRGETKSLRSSGVDAIMIVSSFAHFQIILMRILM